MKAIVQDRYGSADVLELRDIDRPLAAVDEALVRVRAASVHADVWHAMKGVPYVLRVMGSGLRAPKHRVPGTDLAGVVQSVGANVTRFRPGDEVFGQSLLANLWRNGGALAEYATVPEGGLERKPARLTFEQAAAVPRASCSKCGGSVRGIGARACRPAGAARARGSHAGWTPVGSSAP